MNPLLLFHLAGGDAYWTACLLAASAIALVARWRNRWTMVAAWVLILAAGLAYLASGTPQPVWLMSVVMAELVAWLAIEGVRKPTGRPAGVVRVGAAAMVAMSVFLELPWHLNPAIRPPRERKLYVVADSISAGMGTSGVTTWPSLLRQKHGIEVGDFSLAGSTAESALRYLRGKDLGPGLILVEIGGNDMIGGRDPQAFAGSLDALLTELKKRSDSVVMLELPVLPGSVAYAQKQRAIAKRHGVPLIPKRGFAAILTREGNTLDGLHLSSQGQQEMADWIWCYLSEPMGGR